MKTRQEML